MGALTQGTQQVMHLAATMILARLLLPEHFGIIATALVIVNFFSMIRDFGLSEAIMRRQDIDQCHYTSIFFAFNCGSTDSIINEKT